MRESFVLFFFSSRRRHTRCLSDWSSDVCSSDLKITAIADSPIEKVRLVFRWGTRNQSVKNLGAHAILSFVLLQLVDHVSDGSIGREGAVGHHFKKLFLCHTLQWFSSSHLYSLRRFKVYKNINREAS